MRGIGIEIGIGIQTALMSCLVCLSIHSIFLGDPRLEEPDLLSSSPWARTPSKLSCRVVSYYIVHTRTKRERGRDPSIAVFMSGIVMVGGIGMWDGIWNLEWHDDPLVSFQRVCKRRGLGGLGWWVVVFAFGTGTGREAGLSG